MKTFSQIALSILLTLFSCANKQDEKVAKKQINLEAIRLNDSALMMHPTDSAEFEKAIQLLNQAIALDSNYFNAHYHKMSFHSALKQYDKALKSAKELIRLQPESAYNYGTAGVIYEKIGDSLSAHEYFQTAKAKFEILLDTLSTNNKSYLAAQIAQATNLIMLNEQTEANKVLKEIYEKENDAFLKDYIASFMNKSKNEILKLLENPMIEEVREN